MFAVETSLKIIAWFWFSGLPSPIIGSPGSLTLKVRCKLPSFSSSIPTKHEAKPLKFFASSGRLLPACHAHLQSLGFDQSLDPVAFARSIVPGAAWRMRRIPDIQRTQIYDTNLSMDGFFCFGGLQPAMRAVQDTSNAPSQRLGTIGCPPLCASSDPQE